MSVLELPRFLRNLNSPLGYKDLDIDDRKLMGLIECLNIRVRKGKVTYPEVLWTTVHACFYISNPTVSKCEPVVNLMKKLKRRYPDLGNNIKMDELCGMRDYGNLLTAYKAYFGQKIARRWRVRKELHASVKSLRDSKL